MAAIRVAALLIWRVCGRSPVILFWLGLALAFANAPVALITLLYVLPSYWLYMRSEEAMMRDAFGDAYREYERAVPMLLPRWRRSIDRPAPVSASGGWRAA